MTYIFNNILGPLCLFLGSLAILLALLIAVAWLLCVAVRMWYSVFLNHWWIIAYIHWRFRNEEGAKIALQRAIGKEDKWLTEGEQSWIVRSLRRFERRFSAWLK